MFFDRSDHSIGIATDNGWYPGTIEEYNVRALAESRRLPNVPLLHPLVSEILDNSIGYGCGWGGIGKLHPITAEQEAQLQAAEEELSAARARAEAEELAREEAHFAALIKAGLCLKCGTFCERSCR
jgi:hypothetical protein